MQTHTDWVNDMVLCNMNQTVITASSDRTIRAWSPHTAEGEEELAVPALIGHHTDYVRSLAFARQAGVLFSGALDRDISVWDVASPRPNDPVLKVRLSEIDDHNGSGLEGEWGSIYALGVGEYRDSQPTTAGCAGGLRVCERACVPCARTSMRDILPQGSAHYRPNGTDAGGRHARARRTPVGPPRR